MLDEKQRSKRMEGIVGGGDGDGCAGGGGVVIAVTKVER